MEYLQAVTIDHVKLTVEYQTQMTKSWNSIPPKFGPLPDPIVERAVGYIHPEIVSSEEHFYWRASQECLHTVVATIFQERRKKAAWDLDLGAEETSARRLTRRLPEVGFRGEKQIVSYVDRSIIGVISEYRWRELRRIDSRVLLPNEMVEAVAAAEDAEKFWSILNTLLDAIPETLLAATERIVLVVPELEIELLESMARDLMLLTVEEEGVTVSRQQFNTTFRAAMFLAPLLRAVLKENVEQILSIFEDWKAEKKLKYFHSLIAKWSIVTPNKYRGRPTLAITEIENYPSAGGSDPLHRLYNACRSRSSSDDRHSASPEGIEINESDLMVALELISKLRQATSEVDASLQNTQVHFESASETLKNLQT